VYVNPQPKISSDKSAELYSKEYFDSGYMRFYSDDNEGALQSNEPFDFRMRLIEKYKKNGVLLDVGCATGAFLSCAQEAGWDTRGVDVSDFALEVCRTKRNLCVKKGTLEEVNFPERFFDVICASDILEHTQNPLSFLREAGRILKDDGILYFALPDFGSLHYQLMSLISRFNHKNYFVLPHHLYHFTSRTLEKLLSKAGFSILERRASESIIQEQGFRRIFLQALFFLARILRLKDRMVIIASKSKK
jgi:ubiquinone/menaquinone biosynthesis C-methylase UbiE